MTSLHPKLAEAAFFIELFRATEQRTEPLTSNSDLVTEASYLFSAVLNSFYSALDQWRSTTKDELANKAFVARFPEIYAHSHKGGWRSTTVHIRHLSISHAGNIPQDGGNVKLVLSRRPKLASDHDKSMGVTLRLHPKYYVEYNGALKEVVSIAREQLSELHRLFSESNAKNESQPDGDA